MKNIYHLFSKANGILEFNKLHLFLHFDCAQIDYNKYLENLETATEVIVYAEVQIKNLSIYFGIKIYAHFKDILYPLNIYYSVWHLLFDWLL